METEVKNSPDTLSVVHEDLSVRFLRQMKLIRRFEEKAAEEYTRSNIRGFLHLYIGEEAVAVGVIAALRENDNILSTYREHGHALARGVDPGKIMAEMYGKKEGCSLGRGGSMHLFDKSRKFFGGNAIVAGHLPLAVGMALAAKKKNTDELTCCFFGEGAAAEGEFHESMNLASLWKTPLLMVCENNLYAMGTAIRYSHSVQQIEKKGPAYDIETAVVDGMDVLAVNLAARKAVEYIQKEHKPYFLVCNTYRFRAHSMFDAELYRDKSEVEEWKRRDPVNALQNILSERQLITEADLVKMDAETEAIVSEAVRYAEAGTYEPVEDLKRFVYSENSQ